MHSIVEGGRLMRACAAGAGVGLHVLRLHEVSSQYLLPVGAMGVSDVQQCKFGAALAVRMTYIAGESGNSAHIAPARIAAQIPAS